MDLDFVCRWLSDAISWLFQPELAGFLALFLTLWGVRTTRKHNHLSVMPMFTDQMLNIGNRFSYDVTNKGLGPAKLSRF